MRLHKFLSKIGFCSKRHGEELIRSGKIYINGRKAIIGDTVDGTEDIVIDGKTLQEKEAPKKKVLAFYKPKGVECTLTPYLSCKTLLDFDFGTDRVFPIGRLDRDCHGLLLLTNDGVLGNKLAKPCAEREEEYTLEFQEIITKKILNQFTNGIVLKNKKTAPCHVVQLEDNVIRITLHDGRNRQIRQMCESIGLHLLDISRVRIGQTLLHDLKDGEWRVLSDKEFQEL